MGLLLPERGGPELVLSPDMVTAPLERADPALHLLLAAERQRAAEHLSLLAGECLPARATAEAASPELARRWAEGLPGGRLGGGADVLDGIEELACGRACALFAAEHANVQPASDTQALLAAYQALCRPGATILALDPGCGGHPAHGSPLHLAGRIYRFVHYGVDRSSERLDMDEVWAVARRERPAVLVAGGAAHPRAFDHAACAEIARAVGAHLVVDLGHTAGPVAAGLLPNPVRAADVTVVPTGTTLCGPRGAALLCRAEWARAVDRAVFPGLQGAVAADAVAAKAACLGLAAGPEFAGLQARALGNAAELAASFARAGFRPVSGGTDTSMLVVDLRAHGLSGRQAERALDGAGLLCNRQPVPFDPLPPLRSSGLRLGTTVTTQRGMGAAEMREVAALAVQVLLAATEGPEVLQGAAAAASASIADLARRFPLPGWSTSWGVGGRKES